MSNLIETIMNTLGCDYDEAAKDCYPLFCDDDYDC